MKKSELRKLIRQILNEQTPVQDIPGCTDPAAGNYNENATVDDGSCNYLEPIGGQSAVDNPNPVGQTLQGKPQKPPTSPVFDMSDPSTYSCSQPQIQQICDIELMNGELFCHSDYWSMGNNPQANFACTQCCPETSEDLDCMDLEIQAIIGGPWCAAYDTTLQPGDNLYNPMMDFACTQCGATWLSRGSRGKKSMRESLKLTRTVERVQRIIESDNILKEQTPSSADCSQLQSMIDPNMYEMVCGAQCAGNTGGFGNNQALLNIASCCECPEPPPTPGQEDPCRRIMDDIIPNEYNSTPKDWCKKNCKDVNSIVMINYGNDQVNGCKCCGEFDIDQVGPVQPQSTTGPGPFGMWLNQTTIWTCEPGTTFAPTPANYTNPDYCVNQQGQATGQPFATPFYPGFINPWIVSVHESFQENCCEGNSDFGSDYPYGYEQYGESWSGTPLIPLPPGTPPYGVSESLVKRFKKLANIKKRK